MSAPLLHTSRNTHPIADVIGGANIYEGTDTALQERADVELRREPVVVEVCPERRVDIRSAVAEVSLPGRVNAEEILRALVIEELADLSAEPDGSQVCADWPSVATYLMMG